jgi:hypothetical protein
MGLEFDVVVGEDIYHPRNPVYESLPAKEIDYGRLFTYAFRRFGLPNAGSDGYKEIANWFLTTPHPDLLLILRPTPLPGPEFSIKFYVPEELAFACRGWERADIDAWLQRKLDWVEKQGLPDWLPQITDRYAREMCPGATWREFYLGCIILYEPRETKWNSSITSGQKEEEDELKKALTEFAARCSEYRNIEPCPAFRKRDPELEQWAEDDPLKPLAYAAIEAIADLNTGVRVRDTAINAFGMMADGEGRVVNEPSGAGNTVGLMFNNAPHESVQMQRAAYRVGGGDYKAGLKHILELVETEKL